MAMPTMTGSRMLRLKVSPRVMMFGLPSLSTDVTRLAGEG